MYKGLAFTRRLGVIGFVLAFGIASLGYAGGRSEQARSYGPGMMGGSQGGPTGAYGHGMMGGSQGGPTGAYGHGMMGGGMMGGGMMGSGFDGLDNSLQRTIDIKKAQGIVSEYLAGLSNKKLMIDEIMEFENNLYALIKESDTGKGAFELLIDPFTGALRPEFGPNMMWNIKYGMMGARSGAVRTNVIDKEEAKKIASEYVERVRGKGPYTFSVDEFYGYYTLDVKKDDMVLGMLSVNAFSGQVWYHTWHGGYIGMQEGMSEM